MCATIASSCLFVIKDICVVVMALREYIFHIRCTVCLYCLNVAAPLALHFIYAFGSANEL